MRARNTTSRSHEGMRCLSGTLRRVILAIKRDARGWLPGEMSFTPAWQAEMAATYTLRVEAAFPSSTTAVGILI